ncbi:MAG: class I SAM-dependent methyltransferase [Actinomycetota bacterium]
MNETDPAKEVTKLIWSLGNYEEVARTTLPAANELVATVGVDDGDEVLDVATGSGNVALLAAQRGARVSACDLTPAMLELARRRASSDGQSIELSEGDAESLPYVDNRFDHVLSTFGAMFAPRPEVAAAELFRVAKPGGTIGMANWTPDGLLGRQGQIMQAYAPGEQPEVDPMSWGIEEAVAQRLGPHAESVETSRLYIREEYESWDEFVSYYETDLGPAIALKQVLEPHRYAEMMERLRELYESFNQSEGGRIVADSEYLQVIARKPRDS